MTDDKFFYLEGREVILKAGSSNIFNLLNVPEPNKVRLFYDEETALNFKSEYENLVDLGGTKLLNIASAASGGFIPSGQFAAQGFQIWKETDVVEFSVTVTLHMQDSGLNQVVIPALALSKLCVPSKKNNENKTFGQSLIPPGPDLQVLLANIGIEIGEEDKTSYSVDGVVRDPLSVIIGKFLTVENVIITKIEPTFSDVLDEDYMPVSCSLSIDFRTIEVANTDMINKMINHAKSRGQ